MEFSDKQELKANVERVMHRLQKLPNIVAGFFGAPTCAYANVWGFTLDWLNKYHGLEVYEVNGLAHDRGYNQST